MIRRSANKWFAHQNTNPNAKINLLCFVFAGGSPSFFAPWKKKFPEYINFMPVLYPGRETRAKEKMPDNMSELIERFRQENKGIFEKPYAIWGHCSGSLIGLELAHIESKAGNPPVAFIVSGCEAPQYALMRLQSAGDFNKVSDEAILKDLIDFNLVKPEMIENQAFRDYFFPIYHADLNMLSKYSCSFEGKLNCPALVMNGKDDKMIKPERIPQWEERFSAEVKFIEYSGEHYFVNDHADEVTNEICRQIIV